MRKKLKQKINSFKMPKLAGLFSAAALATSLTFSQQAQADESVRVAGYDYAPIGQADILIRAQNLNVTSSQVSFVIDKRRINPISFLTARTGQIYTGTPYSNRECPVFRVSDHNFTRTDQGHLRTVFVNVSATDARVIERHGCVTIPDMRLLPR